MDGRDPPDALTGRRRQVGGLGGNGVVSDSETWVGVLRVVFESESPVSDIAINCG